MEKDEWPYLGGARDRRQAGPLDKLILKEALRGETVSTSPEGRRRASVKLIIGPGLPQLREISRGDVRCAVAGRKRGRSPTASAAETPLVGIDRKPSRDPHRLRAAGIPLGAASVWVRYDAIGNIKSACSPEPTARLAREHAQAGTSRIFAAGGAEPVPTSSSNHETGQAVAHSDARSQPIPYCALVAG